MRFTVLAGPETGRTLLMKQKSGILGRGGDKSISLADPRVSRSHARVEMVGAEALVQDLGSTHGLFVRGSRVPSGIPVTIRPGDELRLGDTVLRFDGVSSNKDTDAIDASPGWPGQFGRWNMKVLVGLALVLLTVIAIVIVLLMRRPPSSSTAQSNGATPTRATTLATPQATTTDLPPVVVLPTSPASVAGSTATFAVPAPQPTNPNPPATTAPPGGGAQQPGNGAFPALGGQDLARIPAAVAQLFPGVSPEDLPQAVMAAVAAGSLSPEQLQNVLGALFPGVSLRDLPQAIARAFPGVPRQELQSILDQAFAGQNLNLSSIPPLSGLIYVGVFENGKYRIIEADTLRNTQRHLIEDASEPALSPDRTWLAYYSWRDDTRGLRLRHLVSGEDRTLTDKALDAYPSWAPDQGRLALQDGMDGTILTVNRDGTDRRPLGMGQFPAWSPRGGEIAYKGCLTGGDCGLIVNTPDGRQPRLLTNNANDGQPAWSPDGKSLAFVSNRDGNWEIYAINSDGSWLRRVTTHQATDGLPEFAPDGLRVAFRSDREGVWAVWTALGLGGPAIKLFEANAGPTWQFEKISWR